MKDRNKIIEIMDKIKMNEELEKIDRSVNRMFLVLSLGVVLIATTIVVCVSQSMTSNKVKKDVTSVSNKVDTTIGIVQSINQNLITVNQKLDESIQSSKHLMNGIGDVTKDVNKVNVSVQKVGKSVDTLIIYIKK